MIENKQARGGKIASPQTDGFLVCQKSEEGKENMEIKWELDTIKENKHTGKDMLNKRRSKRDTTNNVEKEGRINLKYKDKIKLPSPWIYVIADVWQKILT